MPCEWCHLSHVIVLRLNNQPHGGPGIGLFEGGCLLCVFRGVRTSQAESVPGWDSLGRDEKQFSKLMCIGLMANEVL